MSMNGIQTNTLGNRFCTLRFNNSNMLSAQRTGVRTSQKDSQSKSAASTSAVDMIRKIKYSFKQISSQILRARTSANAGQVVTKARNKVAQLKRQVKGMYDYDEELMSALTHAMQIERVAKKKEKHLEQEENIARKSEPGMEELTEDELDEEDELELEMQDSDAQMDEKMQEDLQKQMQQLMEEMAQEEMRQRMEEFAQQMQEEMEEMLEEMESMSGMDELSENLLAYSEDEMEPADLELLKKKHRCEEQREIMEADMKYLRAMFQRLEREKQSAGSSGITSGSSGASGGSADSGSCSANDRLSADTGVFLSIGNKQTEVSMPDVTISDVFEGANVDLCV